IRSIANAATAVVPFMAIAYIIVAVIIVIMNIGDVPALIGLIFRSAFGLEQQFAGTVGAMIMIGVKRGLYSNEAGQGTGAHAAGAAEVSTRRNRVWFSRSQCISIRCSYVLQLH